MLGHKLVQKLSEYFDVWTTIRSNAESYGKFKFFYDKRTFENVSVENVGEIEKIIGEIKPDAVINAVGIIKQAPSSQDVVQTLTVNSIFPHRLAEITKKYNSRLINFSTDCVFIGKKGNYNEKDTPDAIDLYGKSKNFGEVVAANCLTLRTSIIGRELGTSHSLVEWLLRNRGGKVKGYVNAVFSGFPTVVMSEIIRNLLTNHKNLEGLYHLSSNPINKFDLLNLVKREYKINVEIEPDEDFCIDRSLDSTAFKEATGFESQSWEKMIQIMVTDTTPYGL